MWLCVCGCVCVRLCGCGCSVVCVCVRNFPVVFDPLQQAQVAFRLLRDVHQRGRVGQGRATDLHTGASIVALHASLHALIAAAQMIATGAAVSAILAGLAADGFVPPVVAPLPLAVAVLYVVSACGWRDGAADPGIFCAQMLRVHTSTHGMCCRAGPVVPHTCSSP